MNFICDLQGSSQILSISAYSGRNSNYDNRKIRYNQKGFSGMEDGVSFNKSFIILGHEIAHAWQHMIGHSEDMEKSYGNTKMKEVFAVKFENYLRAHDGETKM